MSEFTERHGIAPCLAAVLAGDDPASHAYVASKAKAAGRVGIRSETFALPADVPAAEYFDLIDTLNRRADVHGILPQLPLPPQIAADAVFARLNPEKDVDGLTPVNMGRLALGRPGIVPCTPLGIIALIDSAGVSPAGGPPGGGLAGHHDLIAGREAVVVGRSNIVGKPVALLLLARHATVTICHSRTPDLAAQTRRADILVAAVGHPHLIRAAMVKPGAVVIDVGLTRVDGKIAGDVDFDAVREVAGAITPMPGGTGPMTIAMVLENTLTAARRQLEHDEA